MKAPCAKFEIFFVSYLLVIHHTTIQSSITLSPSPITKSNQLCFTIFPDSFCNLRITYHKVYALNSSSIQTVLSTTGPKGIPVPVNRPKPSHFSSTASNTTKRSTSMCHSTAYLKNVQPTVTPAKPLHVAFGYISKSMVNFLTKQKNICSE